MQNHASLTLELGKENKLVKKISNLPLLQIIFDISLTLEFRITIVVLIEIKLTKEIIIDRLC